MKAGRRQEIGGTVPRMDEAQVAGWLDGLAGTGNPVLSAAAAVAMECLMEVATRRRVRRCGRPADAIVVPTLKGFLQ